MPRREIQVSIERNDTFEDFGKVLKAKRKAKNLSQHELGHNVGEGVDQSTISRIEQGLLNLSWSLANDVMRTAGFRRDEIEYWLGALFGVAPAIDPQEIEHISIQLDFHLRRGVREHPRNSSYFGSFVANRLEHTLCRSADRTQSARMLYLAQQARLLEAWGRVCIVPTAEFPAILEDVAETIDTFPSNHQLYYLGSTLLNTAETMLTGQAADIDELERLVSQAKTPHSYAIAFLHEELARQYLISSVHTLEQFTVVLDAGKQYCQHSPALKTHLVRLESLAAWAISAKLGEPLLAADKMRRIIRQLRRPEHFNPSQLAESLGIEASMRLSAGQRTPVARRLLNEAYGWANYLEGDYIRTWIKREADRFDIPLDSA